MKSGIYQIVNKVNQKRYIGYSVDCLRRFRQHRNNLNYNIHSNSHLQKAWNKYGSANFSFEILDFCSEENLVFKEHYWCTILKVHNPEFGYNEKPTCEEGYARLSESIKEKIRLGQQMYREKHVDSKRFNYHHSIETKNKISSSNKGKTLGRKLNKEITVKISKANKGKKKPIGFGENVRKLKSKRIRMIDSNNTVQDFISLKDCARYLLVNCTRTKLLKSIESRIGDVLYGRLKTYMGMTFEYVVK